MRYILKVVFLVGSFCMSTVSMAQTESILTLMEEAVENSPSLQIAQSDINRARASAKRISVSPYEYEISASGGQRIIDDPLSPDTEFTEFGAGVSKTIRLPSKKRLDERLSDIEIDISELAVEVAVFEEKLTFIKLWNAWAQAHRLVAVSQDQAKDAAELASLELIKVEKGAGRQVNADILLAQSQMAEVLAQRDIADANRAKFTLQSRYPMIILPEMPFSLSSPSRLTSADNLNTLPDYPAQRLAALQSEKMRLKARREALNRRPDPTLGFSVSNEFGGRETSLMGTVSIPLGGKLRRARTGEAQAQALKSEIEERLAYQLAMRDYEFAKDNAESFTALIVAADKALIASRAAVADLQRGYDLGAITAQDIIVARKSLRDAERTYVDYVGQAEAAKLLLMLYQTQT